LGKLVGRVDMDDRERDVPGKGPFREPEEDVGIFAHRPKQANFFEGVISLAKEVNTVRFQFVEVRHGGTGWTMIQGGSGVQTLEFLESIPIFARSETRIPA